MLRRLPTPLAGPPVDFSELLPLVQSRNSRVLDSVEKPVWIFGAGSFGRAVRLALLDRGTRVAGFIETCPRWQTVDGAPVIDWTEAADRARNADIVLGVFNRETPYDGLVEVVRQAGFAPPYSLSCTMGISRIIWVGVTG